MFQNTIRLLLYMVPTEKGEGKEKLSDCGRARVTGIELLIKITN